MNQSILIADDEELIRQGIIARLEYLGFKPAAVYEAENGVRALDLLKKHKVDIMITDIRMADMDGLTLIKRTRPLFPKLQFIILSGYAEFAYAQQAIRLGVKAYLLKPISNDALKKAMEEVLAELEEGKQLSRTVSEGTRSIVERQGYLFEKNINNLLRNPEGDKEAENIYDIVDKEFPLKNKRLTVGIVNIDGDSYEQRKFGYKDIDLIKFSIKNVFMEIKTYCHKIIVSSLADTNQLFAVISSGREEYLIKETEWLFTELINTLWKNMGVRLTIGISSVKDTLSAENAKEAQEAYLQRMIYARPGLYFYNHIKTPPAGHFPTSELNRLHQYIERHDAGNIEFLINEIFSDEKIKKYNVSYIRILWVRIADILLKAENTTFAKDSRNVEKLVLGLEVLNSFHSLKQFRSYLYSLILEGIQSDGDIDINSKNKIKLAIKYIHDNYNRDIAINEMAEKYNMSPNYFSAVFKRETGMTTMHFIKDLRLKKACEYLLYSDKSVVEISKEVGYEDSQYFFKVFKKAIGQTPLQYRKMHI